MNEKKYVVLLDGDFLEDYYLETAFFESEEEALQAALDYAFDDAWGDGFAYYSKIDNTINTQDGEMKVEIRLA